MSTDIKVQISGIGTAVPRNIMTNADFESILDTSDHWISTRTGIQNRRWATPEISTGDLAVAAGHSALKHAGIDQVDRVIVTTTTPDYICPATAPWVASQLGMGTISAFDVSAVCSGFIYAIALGYEAIRSNTANSTLIIAAETFSRLLNPSDRTTSVIFGDGAGAIVLEKSPNDKKNQVEMPTLGSNGNDYDAIIVPGGGSRHSATSNASDKYFTMDGRRVFHTAVKQMATTLSESLINNHLTIDDCDWLVAHQANKRILTAVAKQLQFPVERVIVDLENYGNTSCASIPLALAHHSHRFIPGQRILLSAFGGGTTWGATSIIWPEFSAPIQPDIELGASNV